MWVNTILSGCTVRTTRQSLVGYCEYEQNAMRPIYVHVMTCTYNDG